jgi:hypothetical protein
MVNFLFLLQVYGPISPTLYGLTAYIAVLIPIANLRLLDWRPVLRYVHNSFYHCLACDPLLSTGLCLASATLHSRLLPSMNRHHELRVFLFISHDTAPVCRLTAQSLSHERLLSTNSATGHSHFLPTGPSIGPPTSPPTGLSTGPPSSPPTGSLSLGTLHFGPATARIVLHHVMLLLYCFSIICLSRSCLTTSRPHQVPLVNSPCPLSPQLFQQVLRTIYHRSQRLPPSTVCLIPQLMLDPTWCMII